MGCQTRALKPLLGLCCSNGTGPAQCSQLLEMFIRHVAQNLQQGQGRGMEIDLLIACAHYDQMSEAQGHLFCPPPNHRRGDLFPLQQAAVHVHPYRVNQDQAEPAGNAEYQVHTSDLRRTKHGGEDPDVKYGSQRDKAAPETKKEKIFDPLTHLTALPWNPI